MVVVVVMVMVVVGACLLRQQDSWHPESVFEEVLCSQFLEVAHTAENMVTQFTVPGTHYYYYYYYYHYYYDYDYYYYHYYYMVSLTLTEG